MTRTFCDAGVLIAAARSVGPDRLRALQLLEEPERVFLTSPFIHLEVVPKTIFYKKRLVVRIDRTIRQRKLTQAAAAQLMGIDQPKISAMLAGQFRGYSVERLMRFLVALGHDVEIVVRPRKRGTAELRVA